MASLQLKDVRKTYPNGQEAIHGINLDIRDGEFVVIVGPSGCGKSTLLRMVAGLEEITSGEAKIDGKIVNQLEPSQRDIAMVFQNYALYPHMNVFDNMAYGLKIQKLPKEEIQQRVDKVAKMLGIEEFLKRKPKALSGGQRQRVAMGRAIVRRPKVYLFDEPLSNLDAKLRIQMRLEIAKLHRKLGTTSLYVTHDQIEAMTLADRIAVLNGGNLEQFGTPAEIFDHPASVFVAQFIGSPPMNIVRLEIDNKGRLIIGENKFVDVSDSIPDDHRSKEIFLGLRPEYLVENSLGIPAVVESIETLGSEKLYHLMYKDTPIVMRRPAAEMRKLEIGETIGVWHSREHPLHWFDIDTKLAIRKEPNPTTEGAKSKDGSKLPTVVDSEEEAGENDPAEQSDAA